MRLGPRAAQTHDALSARCTVRYTSSFICRYDSTFLGSLLGFWWIDRQAEWTHISDFVQRWPNLTVLGTEAAEGFEPWSRGPKLGSWWRLETYAYDGSASRTQGAVAPGTTT